MQAIPPQLASEPQFLGSCARIKEIKSTVFCDYIFFLDISSLIIINNKCSFVRNEVDPMTIHYFQSDWTIPFRIFVKEI